MYCEKTTNETKKPEVDRLIIDHELLNIIRRAAATKRDFDLAIIVRAVLEIPEKGE